MYASMLARGCVKSVHSLNGCFTEALYEKQTIMTYENETAKLQGQVNDSEATSAEKDTFIARYEGRMKECEGEINS